MSKYEFLPGDKVLIKGREDTGEWEVYDKIHIGFPVSYTVTQKGMKMTAVDGADLVRVNPTPAFKSCWFQVGDVTLYPECPPTKMATLQAEVALATAQQKEKVAEFRQTAVLQAKTIDDLRRKISHLDDSIDHQDKVIEDLRRKTLLDAGEINAQRDTIREQRQRRINERECRGAGLYIRAFLGEEL